MNDDLLLYMRRNPSWHIILSRDPNRIEELKGQYKQVHGKTIGSKVEQLSMILNMMEMML